MIGTYGIRHSNNQRKKNRYGGNGLDFGQQNSVTSYFPSSWEKNDGLFCYSSVENDKKKETYREDDVDYMIIGMQITENQNLISTTGKVKFVKDTQLFNLSNGRLVNRETEVQLHILERRGKGIHLH